MKSINLRPAEFVSSLGHLRRPKAPSTPVQKKKKKLSRQLEMARVMGASGRAAVLASATRERGEGRRGAAARDGPSTSSLLRELLYDADRGRAR